jgi:hypothetical protein
MPDPAIQSPTDFEIEKFLANYSNPRGLSKKWLEGYLNRSKPLLAIDVIRAFDIDHQQQRTINRIKMAIYLFGAANAFLLCVVSVLGILKGL